MVNKFEEFEYFAGVLHGASQFKGDVGPHVLPPQKLLNHLGNLGVLVAAVVELGDILNDGTYFIPAFAGFHKQGEGGDVGGHMFTIEIGLFLFLDEEGEGAFGNDSFVVFHWMVRLVIFYNYNGDIIVVIV